MGQRPRSRRRTCAMKCCASSLRPRRCMRCASAKYGSGNSGANSVAFLNSGSAVTKSPRSYAARPSWYSRLALSRRSSSADSLDEACTPAPCPDSCINNAYQLTAVARGSRRGILAMPNLHSVGEGDHGPSCDRQTIPSWLLLDQANLPTATACPERARWEAAGVAVAIYTARVARCLSWSTSAPWAAAGYAAWTRGSGGARRPRE